MTIAIIEDEVLTSEDLSATILDVLPNAQIVATLRSVKSSITWLINHKAPDLIFSDIQLGDGLSFQIFKEVKVQSPVIFCTAYDEHALQAFRANGIGYIVKPFSRESITHALVRYQQLKEHLRVTSFSYDRVISMLEEKKPHRTASILVFHKEKIVPVRIKDVAIFFIDNEQTNLLTFDGGRHNVDKSLDELERIGGSLFFRANRQHLIHRKAVNHAAPYFIRKLSVKLNVAYHRSVIVSKAKATSFLNWLENTAQE